MACVISVKYDKTGNWKLEVHGYVYIEKHPRIPSFFLIAAKLQCEYMEASK